MLKKIGVVLVVVFMLFILGCSSENKYLDYATVVSPEEIEVGHLLTSVESDSELVVLSSTFQEVENPDTGDKRNNYAVIVFNEGSGEILLNEVSACYDEDCEDKESVVLLGDDLSMDSEEAKLIFLATKIVPLKIIINHDYMSEEETLSDIDVWFYSSENF